MRVIYMTRGRYLLHRFSAAIGHYTAMIWSTTNKIGCGVTEFKEGKWFAKLYTCNYGPAGNFINGEMYKQGQSCSKCPQGMSCSEQYPGLCGNLTHIAHEGESSN